MFLFLGRAFQIEGFDEADRIILKVYFCRGWRQRRLGFSIEDPELLHDDALTLALHFRPRFVHAPFEVSTRVKIVFNDGKHWFDKRYAVQHNEDYGESRFRFHGRKYLSIGDMRQ